MLRRVYLNEAGLSKNLKLVESLNKTTTIRIFAA